MTSLETRDLAWFKARKDRGDYSVADLTHREAMALHVEVTTADSDALEFKAGGAPIGIPPGCSGVIFNVPFRIRDD